MSRPEGSGYDWTVRRLWFAALFGFGASLHGCGDDAATAADGGADGPASSGPCLEELSAFPGVDPVPKGMAILGTGYDHFIAMPEELPLVFGSQNGFNVDAHVQMSGLEPGDPANLYDPSNPRTRVRAYFADDGRPLNDVAKCPFRVGYQPEGGATYELARGVPVVFDTCWRAEHLIGRQLVIKLEVVDSTNGLATDERVVTAVAPIDPTYPTAEGRSGCVYEDPVPVE